jgi:hypothetical protein
MEKEQASFFFFSLTCSLVTMAEMQRRLDEATRRADEEAALRAEATRRADEEAALRAKATRRADDEARRADEEARRADEEAALRAEATRRANDEAALRAEATRRANDETRRADAEAQARFNMDLQNMARSRARLLAQGVTVRLAPDASESVHIDGTSHQAATIGAWAGDLADVADVCAAVDQVFGSDDQGQRVSAWRTLQKPLTEPSKCVYAHAVSTEADVARVVISMVEDLLGVLGLEMLVKSEKMLMGWRPDICLLLLNGRVVGVIEVKKNGTEAKNPFSAEPVAGQLFNYVRLLEQTGVRDAVAMLHTGSRAAIVKCAPGGARTLLMTDVAAAPAAVAKLTLQFLRMVAERSAAAAAVSVDFSKPVTNRVIRQINSAGSITWTEESTAGLQFGDVPLHSSEKIFLWTELGRGAFGSCFLASLAGRAFALKVMFASAESISAGSIVASSVAASPAAVSTTELSAEHERANIATIYHVRNGWSAAVVALFDGSWAVTRNRLPMLAMPLCRPLTVGERQSRLGDVQGALEMLAASGLVFCLESNDFGWRHVMTLQNEVVFVDFGSLVPLRSPPPQWVAAAMTVLRDSVGPPVSHSLLGMSDVDPSNTSSSSSQ